MQSNTNNTLDLDKRKMCSGQYDMSPPSDGGTWTQLQEKVWAKIKSEQIIKSGKSDKTKITVGIIKLKDKTKSRKRLRNGK